MVPEAYVSNVVPTEVSTSVRAATTILAPWAAKPRQMAQPMPRLAPVTIATLSCKVIDFPSADASSNRPYLSTNVCGTSTDTTCSCDAMTSGAGETVGPAYVGGATYDRGYWITDLGVASRRVTLMASRSINMGTWGAMTFFQ